MYTSKTQETQQRRFVNGDLTTITAKGIFDPKTCNSKVS